MIGEGNDQPFPFLFFNVEKKMSNIIRQYKCIEHHLQYEASHTMSIASTIQGKYGHGIQFTLMGRSTEYIVLAENQIKDLITILQKRLDCEEGYSATDTIDPEEIHPLEKKDGL